jgi:hypothetical protein
MKVVKWRRVRGEENLSDCNFRNRDFTAFTCNDEPTEWKEIPLGYNLSRRFGLRQKQQNNLRKSCETSQLGSPFDSREGR